MKNDCGKSPMIEAHRKVLEKINSEEIIRLLEDIVIREGEKRHAK